MQQSEKSRIYVVMAGAVIVLKKCKISGGLQKFHALYKIFLALNERPGGGIGRRARFRF